MGGLQVFVVRFFFQGARKGYVEEPAEAHTYRGLKSDVPHSMGNNFDDLIYHGWSGRPGGLRRVPLVRGRRGWSI
ncbi:hypothetical protein HYQ46_002269 [Verticillium longisporum]|nr:hypothetical protein HYQ46_002269 [Verticillium longisporum]